MTSLFIGRERREENEDHFFATLASLTSFNLRLIKVRHDVQRSVVFQRLMQK